MAPETFIDGNRNEELRIKLNNFDFVPIIDQSNTLLKIAFKFADKHQKKYEANFLEANTNTFVIAEIGNNHNGNLQSALTLIKLAKEAGADCAKFQLRDLEACYGSLSEIHSPAQNLGSQLYT